MGKNQSASNLTNIVKYDNNGNLSFVSGSTTLLSVSSSGALTTTSTITAQTLVVQTITSSISAITGSTKFGTLSSNTHQFTGSVIVTGSLAVVTTGTEFQVTSTGLNLGNALTDSHVISGSLRVNPNGLFVSSSGRVGINTTNPLSLFDVAVLSSGARRLLVNYDDSLVTIKSANDSATAESLRVWGDNIYFYTGSVGSGGELMRLTNTGNVGIGTSSPATRLNIVGGNSNVGSSTSDYGLAIQAPTSMAQDVGGSILLQGYKTGTSAIGNFAYVAGKKENGTAGNEAGYLSFGTFNSSGIPTERMRITSGGNVQIDNGQLNTPKSLSFQANSSAGGNLGSIDWYNYQWDAAIRAQIKGETDTGLSNGKLTFWTGGGGTSLRMTINAAGSIGAPSGTNIYNASDVRLKRNIETLTDGLTKVNNLRPVKFNWIEGFEPTEEKKDMLGFIAQEVQEVVPEAVENFSNNTVTVGDTTVENTLRVNEKFIIPVLVKAIQELKAEIDELKNNK